MLVIGAKGFAKEVLEILIQNGEDENLCFYDDINIYNHPKLYNRFPILQSLSEAERFFDKASNKFIIGIGNPILRKEMFEKFSNIGGTPVTIISKNAEIGSIGTNIGVGSIIMAGVKVSNDTEIGRGSIIYYNSVITHDVKIGEFCEISPSVNVLGGATIGNKCHLATASIIFPNIHVGNDAIIAAGSVVNKDVPPNTMVAGTPAVIKKRI